MPKYFKLRIYWIFFLLLSGFINARVPEFGTKIQYFCVNDIDKQFLSIPAEKTVTVLFFFNIDNRGQCNILSNLNSSFSDYLTQEKITLIGISMGSDEQFKTIKKDFNLTSKLINDKVGVIREAYDYTCGACFSLFIIDKNGIVRYSKTSIDYYMMGKIIERYLSNTEN